jgi:hypothetical protein
MLVRAAPAAWLRASGSPRTWTRHGDLGGLERDVAAIADDLGADVDQLLAQADQRSRLSRLGQRPRPYEVAALASERMELKADGVRGKRWHNSPVHLIALLPSLIHCSAVPWSRGTPHQGHGC